MTKIISGSVLKFILGESKQTISELREIIHSARDKEEAEHNLQIIKDNLASYKVMKNHIDKNKWKEGLVGGAIAGGLIVGFSPAVGAVAAGATLYRFCASMVVGGTSSLFYNKLRESKCFNREEKRAEFIENLLQEAEDKLYTFETTRSSSLKS